jgi:glycosyltransferase involved in cell wall biosynthesis
VTILTKIVHMTTVHHLYDTRIFHKQCKSLAKSGFDVTLIASQIDNRTAFEQDQIHIQLVKKRKNRILRFLFSSWDVYRMARKIKGVKIFHFHDPELFFVGILLKSKGNRVIYDIHEDYETNISQKRYIPRTLKPMILKCFLTVERFVAKKFDIILAEKYYQERFPNGTTILNYPILQSEHKHSKPLHEEAQADDHKMKLIYTGNITEDRGAWFHASLPHLHPDIEVLLIGHCSPALAEKMTANHDTGDSRLRIEGAGTYIPREQIDRAYQAENWLAGIALFPFTEHYARKELTKFFEYMYAEIPILCSNFPEWEQFIDIYQCGIVADPNDPKRMLEAIDYLATHPEIAKEMGRRGRKAVETELNWEAEAKKLIALYERLLTYNKS